MNVKQLLAVSLLAIIPITSQAQLFFPIKEIRSFGGSSSSECRSAGATQAMLNNERLTAFYDSGSRTCTMVFFYGGAPNGEFVEM